LGVRDAPEIYVFNFIEFEAASILTFFWLSAFLWLLRFNAHAPRLSKNVNCTMKIHAVQPLSDHAVTHAGRSKPIMLSAYKKVQINGTRIARMTRMTRIRADQIIRDPVKRREQMLFQKYFKRTIFSNERTKISEIEIPNPCVSAQSASSVCLSSG